MQIPRIWQHEIAHQAAGAEEKDQGSRIRTRRFGEVEGRDHAYYPHELLCNLVLCAGKVS